MFSSKLADSGGEWALCCPLHLRRRLLHLHSHCPEAQASSFLGLPFPFPSVLSIRPCQQLTTLTTLIAFSLSLSFSLIFSPTSRLHPFCTLPPFFHRRTAYFFLCVCVLVVCPFWRVLSRLIVFAWINRLIDKRMRSGEAGSPFVPDFRLAPRKTNTATRTTTTTDSGISSCIPLLSRSIVLFRFSFLVFLSFFPR